MSRATTVAAFMLWALSSAPTPQVGPAERTQVARRNPYVIGERATYDVKLDLLFSKDVGDATLEVLGIDTIRGRPAYQTMLRVEGGTLGYSLNDSLNSWVDTLALNSLRFHQNQVEREKPRVRLYEIFGEREKYAENGKEERPSVRNPLDDIAFLFHARALPLVARDTVSLPRYFKPEANPIKVVVLRRERVDAPWGKVNAVVVRPIVRTAKLFSEKAKTEMWLTDDSERVILQIKARLPVGSVVLKLKSYRPHRGAPLRR